MAKKLARYGGRAAAVGLISILTIPLLHGDTVPAGELLSPRLGEFLLASNQNITFSGWVDFPQGAGVVIISVHTKINVGSTIASAWTPFAVVSPSATGTAVGGQTRFNWNFSAARNQMFIADSWPEGGTGRLRFEAIRNSGAHAFLRVYDGSMVPSHNEELVLADRNTSPTDLPTVDSPNYLNKKELLAQSETSRYYQSVGTDPHGSGPSIQSALPSLAAFKHRYFDSAATCPANNQGRELTATYFNQGDLGLGREMHCVKNACTHELACYVKNYGNPDGTPIFDRVDKAAAAVHANKPFATVAMVERGDVNMPHGTDNKVFFAVYDHQHLLDPTNPDSAPLALQAPLDNKGFNKSVPTNCLVCHGSASTYTRSSLTPPFNAKVKGALFLPFDLNAFAFFSTTPSNPLSRPEQEAEFKGLNLLVSNSDLRFHKDASELMAGWYDGWTSSTFNGSWVPEDWKNPNDRTDDGNRRQLYQNVVARSCRTCHISHDTLTFSSFDQLKVLAGVAYTDVCGSREKPSESHAMPNAEQSLKQFWRSPARAHFVNRLSLPGDCNIIRRSAAPVPAVNASANARGKALTISTPSLLERYASDSCNCTTLECLSAADEQYLRDLEITPSTPASDSTFSEMLGKATQCRLQVLDSVNVGTQRP